MTSNPLSDRFQAVAVVVAVLAVIVLAVVAAPWWQDSGGPRGPGRTPRRAADASRPAAGRVAPPDLQVADAALEALAGDRSPGHPPLEVTVREGVVTLRGRVSSLAARERAGLLVGTVRGVVRVEDELEVPEFPGAVEDVGRALAEEGALAGLGLEVRSGTRGTVVLSGTVPGHQVAGLAREVAAGVRGVAAVVTDFRIASPEVVPDTDLATQVSRRLQWDSRVEHGAIVVTAKAGGVNLAGSVPSATEKLLALRDAWGPGVVSVSASDLEVRFGPREGVARRARGGIRGDDEVRVAVQERLGAEPRLVGHSPLVAADGGTVTLRGNVPTLASRSRALEAAREVAGVARVEDRLRVVPSRRLADPVREERLQRALERDAWLAGTPVEAKVHDGVATLSGPVDGNFLRARAEEAAGRLEGILEVRNHLQPRDPRPPIDDPYLGGLGAFPGSWDPLPTSTLLRSDRELGEAAQRLLSWSAVVPETGLVVTVDGGEAALKGTLASRTEARAALAAVSRSGVLRVKDRLEIEP